ncbi:serine/threonine-protein kinase [Chondromyces crocatus]|nr:serine/threonine-protein kinase [Chondromyces crocatus]
MGAVYAARDVETDAPVALKVLHREHAGDRGIRNRFAREVRFARRIDHPNVCPALADGHLDDGRPFYLMPLYQGVTLGEEVRRHGPMSLERMFAVADQILAGLAAMHAANVVHRDLQPDNVLLVQAEGGLSIKLIDLGFAHEPGVDTGDGHMPDSPGDLVGTLRFMSPEQALRSRAITERSDLFAVGLLLWFALTGDLPFRGSTDVDMLVSIVRSSPIPLRRRRPDASRELEAILARALAKHPDARFESATEMRSALADVAERARATHSRSACRLQRPHARRTLRTP